MPIPLHSRIEAFREGHQTSADHLLAIKWIGNEGAHYGHLTKDDLLDAFDLFDRVLSLLFLKEERNLQQVTRSILRRRGPRSSMKRRPLF